MSINGVNFNTYSVDNTDNKKSLSKKSNADDSNFVVANQFVQSHSASDSFSSSAARGSVNSWVNGRIGYNTGCTDGSDDGKLSFSDKLKSIGRGALNLVTNLVESVVEHPVKTLLTVGAVTVGSAAVVAAGIISAPALLIGGAVIGVAGGAVKIGQGIIKSSKATTDAEAKQAFESVGEGGATVLASAFTLKKGIKSYEKGLSEARKSAGKSAKSAQESANNATKSASKANEAFGRATQSASSASSDAEIATNAANNTTNIAAEVANDTIKQSSTLAENAAQNARSASQTAQEALANTKNSAGISSSAADASSKYAEIAVQSSEKANQTWSLVRAQKAARTGVNAANGSKVTAQIAASSADDALKFADVAAKSASEASKYSNVALKSLSGVEEIVQSLNSVETNNVLTATLEELKQGAGGVKLSSKQRSALKYKGELVIEQEGSTVIIKKSSALDLYEVSSVKNEVQQQICNSLSDRQIKALDKYVVETNGYKIINTGTETLANGGKIEPKLQQVIDDLTSLIDSQEPIKAGTKVYRTEGYGVFDQINLPDGTKLSDAMRQAAESGDAAMIEKIKTMLADGVFDEVKQPHFLSTSLSPDGTFSTKGEIFWESVVEEGSKGARADILLDYISVDNAATYSQIRKMEHLLKYITREQEILFQNGSNIRITGMDYDYDKAKWILQGVIKN